MKFEETLQSFIEENIDIVNNIPNKQFDVSSLFKMEDKMTPSERYLVSKFRREHEVKELLNSDDALQLVQTIVSGAMIQAMEPDYDIASLFPKISVQPGQAIEFPMAGEIVVDFVEEGNKYPVSTMDFTRFKASDLVKVRKYGGIIPITEEMVSMSSWDVIAMWLDKAGRAMRRFRNAWIYSEIFKHAHVLFDNDNDDVTVHTSGIGPDGNPNGSLTYRDLLKMVMALTMTGFNATHICINGYAWPVFVDNEFLQSFGTSVWNRLQNQPIAHNRVDVSDPEAVLRRAFNGLPQLIVSDAMPIDLVNKKYDILVIDANNIGGLLVEEEPRIPADQWKDPMKDLVNVKVRAKEAPAIYYGGRAIILAKNITLAPTYPGPIVVKTV